MPFYQGFFPAHNELVMTHARLETTHYALDIGYAQMVFLDFVLDVLSCPLYSPLSSLLFLNLLDLFLSFLSYFSFTLPAYFPYTSSLLTAPTPKHPSQHALNTHLWIVLSYLGLLCLAPPCLSKF
jgi:hypothetical protein